MWKKIGKAPGIPATGAGRRASGGAARALGALLAALALLAGCGRAGEPAAEGDAPATPTTPGSGIQLQLLQLPDGTSSGGTGGEGLYFVSANARDDGSTNILYLDFASGETVYLCSQPNCTHDSDSCTSYLPYSSGGIVLEVVGERLILFFPGNSFAIGSDLAAKSVLPHIEVAAPDGSGRKTTLSFEANQEVYRPMLTDGTYIYANLCTVVDSQPSYELVRIDPAAGTYERICPLNQKFVKSGAGSKVILVDGQGNTLTYDLETNTEATLYEAVDMTYPSAIYGSSIVYIENSRFHILDAETGADTAIETFEVGSPADVITSVCDADGGHILFRQETPMGGSGGALADGYYVVTPDAAPEPWGLVFEGYGNAEPARRVSTVGNQYLITMPGSADGATAGGSSGYISTGSAAYALVDFADYWAGAPVTPLGG